MCNVHKSTLLLTKGPFTRAIFCCDFVLLMDVNEWINNECPECVLPHLSICDWITRSHPSKGENRTRNRSCEQALKMYFVPLSLLKHLISRSFCKKKSCTLQPVQSKFTIAMKELHAFEEWVKNSYANGIK